MERSKYYEELVQDLIDNESMLAMLKVENAKVVCLVCGDRKVDKSGRLIYAVIEKITPKYRWATDADAMITVYLGSMVDFSEKKRKIVLLRELLKLAIEDVDGKREVAIRDYDLLDFRCIVERYGANWDQEPTLFDEVEG